MGQVEVIALDEVCASQRRRALRQQLHDYFDQWLDSLEQRMATAPETLPELTTTLWELRQELMGSVMQTIVEHTHASVIDQQWATCSGCHARADQPPGVPVAAA